MRLQLSSQLGPGFKPREGVGKGSSLCVCMFLGVEIMTFPANGDQHLCNTYLFKNSGLLPENMYVMVLNLYQQQQLQDSLDYTCKYTF